MSHPTNKAAQASPTALISDASDDSDLKITIPKKPNMQNSPGTPVHAPKVAMKLEDRVLPTPTPKPQVSKKVCRAILSRLIRVCPDVEDSFSVM